MLPNAKYTTRGTRYCSSIGCSNARGKDPTLAFFRFPRDVNRSNVWVKNCGRQDLVHKDVLELNKGYQLCSQHFENSQFMNEKAKNRLVHDAVPTIFNKTGPQKLSRKRPTSNYESPAGMALAAVDSLVTVKTKLIKEEEEQLFIIPDKNTDDCQTVPMVEVKMEVVEEEEEIYFTPSMKDQAEEILPSDDCILKPKVEVKMELVKALCVPLMKDHVEEILPSVSEGHLTAVKQEPEDQQGEEEIFSSAKNGSSVQKSLSPQSPPTLHTPQQNSPSHSLAVNETQPQRNPPSPSLSSVVNKTVCQQNPASPTLSSITNKTVRQQSPPSPNLSSIRNKTVRQQNPASVPNQSEAQQNAPTPSTTINKTAPQQKSCNLLLENETVKIRREGATLLVPSEVIVKARSPFALKTQVYCRKVGPNVGTCRRYHYLGGKIDLTNFPVGWAPQFLPYKLHVYKIEGESALMCVGVTGNREVFIRVFNEELPRSHPIYAAVLRYYCTVSGFTDLVDLLYKLDEWVVCSGISDKRLVEFYYQNMSKNYSGLVLRYSCLYSMNCERIFPLERKERVCNSCKEICKKLTANLSSS